MRRGIRKDGSVFWCEATLSREEAVPGRDGNLVGVLADVTARHEAEEKFRVIADPGKFGFAGVLGKPCLTADLEQALAAATGGQPR